MMRGKYIMANIYLIEDNLVHLTYLKKKILEYLKKNSLLYSINEIVKIEKFYRDISSFNISETDIFFIDIQLSQYFNGVDLAKKIRNYNSNCFIIFITSENDRGIEIINSNISPFGYIVKDSNDIERINKQIYDLLIKIHDITSNKDNIIVFKNYNRNLLFTFDEIYYFSTIKNNRYQTYLQTYREEYILNGSFATIKKNKFPDYYVRFKSYIINVHQIKIVEQKIGKIIFRNNKELYLSQLLVTKLLKQLH